MAFRETYNNIKTSIATPSPLQTADNASSRGKSQKREASRSLPAAPPPPPPPLSYIPHIDLTNDGSSDSAMCPEELDENGNPVPPPSPLTKAFFRASSYSRSDVLVISLQCMLASRRSLQEIQEVH